MKGLHVDSDKEWYHGELTREQAEMTLRENGSDCFLIRSREQRISCAICDQSWRNTSCQDPTSNYIDGWPKKYKELNELVECFTTSGERISGEICKKKE